MAIIKEKGTISFLSEVQSGVAQSGNPWYRQTIVVDVAGYGGSFRKVVLQASGNVVGDLETAQIGDKVEVSYQVSGREYHGKWYNNVDLYKVEFLDAAMPQQQPTAPAYPQNPQYPQYPQQQMPQVNPQMYPQTAPAAPAAPAPRGRRVASTPQIPANTPMDLQEDDLPPSFYQQ